MKYYRLKRELPTFEKGELFYMDDYMDGFGSIHRAKDDLLVYHYTTVTKFPNMLEDWFEEVPAPARDAKTKAAFEAYLTLHPEQRFFQAVRNFANDHLRYEGLLNCIASIKAEDYSEQNPSIDTFYWECDEMLEEGE